MADGTIVEQNVEASMSRWPGTKVERNWGLVLWISSFRSLPPSALLLTSRRTGVRDRRLSPWQRLMFVAQFRYEKQSLFGVWGEAGLRCREQSLVCEEQCGVVGEMPGPWVFTSLCACLKGSEKGVPVVSCAPSDSQVEGPSPSISECALIWKQGPTSCS